MTQFENYDLEKRTLIFSKNLIVFLNKCPKSTITIPLIDQGLRAGTSVGANYFDDEKLKESCRILWQEAKEFVLIFGKIAASTKN